MIPHLVLSIFPGVDLLGRAFEQEWPEACIVRGPDALWGGDIKTFHPPAGVWDGVIGGPPCQRFSKASRISGSTSLDLIPDFVRVVQEADARWIVMENVTQAIGHTAIPADWHPCVLRDWDCGGETNRTRAFWTWPFALFDLPQLPGKPEHSVMASTWKRGSSASQYVKDKGFLPGDLSIREYGRLQGAEDVAIALEEHRCGKAFAVTVLGNAVPMPMGRIIARAVRRALVAF